MMMLLLLAASLVGISSIYEPENVRTQPQPQQQTSSQQQGQTIIKGVIGNVRSVQVYASFDGKVCLAEVGLPSNIPNKLGVRPGGVIELLSTDESICVLFGQSKVGKTQIMSRVEKLTTLDAIPPTLREDFPPNYPYVYRVHQLQIY